MNDPPPSVVRWADGRTAQDANGFVTGLLVRELRLAGHRAPAGWLDALGRCARPDGSFGFWPEGGRPAWAPELPPDSDDTAVLLTELHLAGRLDRTRTRRVACRTLGNRRLRRVLDPGPPWIRVGTFTTWHRGRDAGVVDLTAVANVLALLRVTGLQAVPGFEESRASVLAGARWAGSSRARWESLSPFYPEPDELRRALVNAARCGVEGLAGAVAAVARACPRRDPDVVCSRAYGPPTWHSPALAALRRDGPVAGAATGRGTTAGP
ncbi:hypothetical protein [Kineococcus rhizosphaerae]|uniref:Prenyltransferase/squalene oxidase-like repeat protein n=1 Tax=Kineococcus rhizosphaerae TaxID=559628 RepID=A0A2T0R8C5_9ACTN|nr:hypothetical protein [Kineococcus rhizosphaerae]PRY17418.1 hypothetical protein CLV37_102381 [Kineococcus rhizosphaerae]